MQEDGAMQSFIKDDVIDKRSQDLNDYYRLNGAIYICKRDNFLKEETFFLKENIYAYIMDKESSIDIDEDIDLKIANALASGIVDKDS